MSFAFVLSLISNCEFRCFLRHNPRRSTKLFRKLRAAERIKDETESASNKEELNQFVDGNG